MIKRLLRKYRRATLLIEISILLFVFVMAYNFFLPIGKEGKLVYFDIDNRQALLETLHKNGYNITDWDIFLVPTHAIPDKGWYRLLHTDEGRYNFFDKLNQHPVKAMHLRIYSGETSNEIIKRLANDMKLNEKTLAHYYHQKARFEEGDLLSGTYSVARGADENTTIHHLFIQTENTIKKLLHKHHIDHIDPTSLNILLTVASIVQKETNNPSEMPIIASVIYNRLGRDMKLQMDGTLNYGKYSHTVVTPKRIKEDITKYNTYKYKGLPPAPLSSVSPEALEAAMFPDATNYLFFMLDKQGSHNFSATYTEHLSHLKAFKRYLKKRRYRRRSSH